VQFAPAAAPVPGPVQRKTALEIQLLRHATLLIRLAGRTLLVDPMLSAKGSLDPVANAANATRIPMTELTLDEDALVRLLRETEAVLVTHTHRDHWDARAAALIPKDKIIFCQPADAGKIQAQGFAHVQPIEDTFSWRGIRLHRTGGQHGTGEIGQKMGPVSGFVLQDDTQSVYIAGDTIWCPEVADALTKYQPAVVVVNAGAAQFLQGDPITMTAEDVAAVCRHAPGAKVIAVHLETVNHCLLTRQALRDYLEGQHLSGRVRIPADGQTTRFA
jgi:L-ascorbate metabolism protein UlaG (beta-lactamase superfamily)